jgi:hypothetical protein
VASPVPPGAELHPLEAVVGFFVAPVLVPEPVPSEPPPLVSLLLLLLLALLEPLVPELAAALLGGVAPAGAPASIFTIGMLFGSQRWLPVQISVEEQPRPATPSQVTEPPQPSESEPHWTPRVCAAALHASVALWGVQRSWLQVLLEHDRPAAHPKPSTESQLTTPPQPSEMNPQRTPSVIHAALHNVVVASGTQAGVESTGADSARHSRSSGAHGVPNVPAPPSKPPASTPAFGNASRYLRVADAIPDEPAHFFVPQSLAYAPTHGV